MTDKFARLILPPIPKRFHPLLWAVLAILIGGLIGWLPINQLVVLIGGSIGVAIVLLKPQLLLYLLIPVIPFSPLISMSVMGITIGFMELLVLALVVALGLQHLLRPQHHSIKTTLTKALFSWPILIFLFGVSLSWLNTLSLRASFIETLKWIEMLGVYIALVWCLKKPQAGWVIRLLLFAGLAQACLGLYQFIFKVGPEGFLLFGGRFLRAYGTFGQPNPYAGYLGLVFPLAAALTFWALTHAHKQALHSPSRQPAPLPSQWEREQASPLLGWGRFYTPLMVIVTIVLFLALFASQSRSGLLAAIVACTVTLSMLSHSFRIVTVLFSLGGLFIGSAGLLTLDLLQTDITGRQTFYQIILQRIVDATAIFRIEDVAAIEPTVANFATLERLAHWQAAWDMWRDNFWLGVGFGNYELVYPAYYVGSWEDPLGHAHNYLFNLGAEAGLIGLICYLIFWMITFLVTWQAVKDTQGFEQTTIIGCLGIFIHLHIHNLFDNLYVQGMYLHIAIILGLITVMSASDTDEAKKRVS